MFLERKLEYWSSPALKFGNSPLLVIYGDSPGSLANKALHSKMQTWASSLTAIISSMAFALGAGHTVLYLSTDMVNTCSWMGHQVTQLVLHPQVVEGNLML